MLNRLWRWLRRQDLIDRLERAVDHEGDRADEFFARLAAANEAHRQAQAARAIEEERGNVLQRRLTAAEAAAAATDSQAHQAAHHYRGIGKSVVACHQIAVKLLADRGLVPLYAQQIRNEFGGDAVDPVLEAMTND